MILSYMSDAIWPDISAVRDKRMELGLTQKELSRLSGVAQPDISRMEKGRVPDPSYNTVRKLFEALKRYELQPQKKLEEPVAEDLMSEDVVSIKPYNLAKDAWEIMKRRHFSQLPVVDNGGRILGVISESTLSSHEVGGKVEVAMGDPFPIVSKNTRLSTLASILRKEPGVLIVDKGRLAGIITQYDLANRAFEKRPSELS
jgi:predicted transcriptional regulator